MSARGETSRNIQRNRTQNDVPLHRLIESADAKSVSPLYQYCRACRRIEAFIIPARRGVDTTPPPAVLAMAQKIGVRVVVIEHSVKDEALQRPIALHVYAPDKQESPQVVPRSTWKVAATFLRSLQTEHEKSSERCSSGYDASAFLAAGQGRGIGETDFSVSNFLRTIPGVRHIDMDASLYCNACNEVYLVIEASSDGMRGTKHASKNKGSSMSRRWGKMLSAHTMLLQHHVGDNEHEKPVQVTMWDTASKDRKPAASVNTWEGVKAEIIQLKTAHASNCPARLKTTTVPTSEPESPPPY